MKPAVCEPTVHEAIVIFDRDACVIGWSSSAEAVLALQLRLEAPEVAVGIGDASISELVGLGPGEIARCRAEGSTLVTLPSHAARSRKRLPGQLHRMDGCGSALVLNAGPAEREASRRLNLLTVLGTRLEDCTDEPSAAAIGSAILRQAFSTDQAHYRHIGNLDDFFSRVREAADRVRENDADVSDLAMSSLHAPMRWSK